jgi:hypothetical protein
MAGKKTAVFGIYKSRLQAEQSVDRLLAAGFSNDDISVLLPNSNSSKQFAHDKNTKARQRYLLDWRGQRRLPRHGWYRFAPLGLEG